MIYDTTTAGAKLDLTAYIKNYSELQEPHGLGTKDMSFIQVRDANFSKYFSLNRLGVHHVTIEPGFRSSFPHAESLEEEFVYVLSGTVHAWINGDIYELTEGWAIGFPAGDGICHSFINNSSSQVELLVIGERTKKENQYHYPMNPELKPAHEQYWWEAAPLQTFGAHKGLPGPLKSSILLPNTLSFAAYVPHLIRAKPFHYPGDNETFGDGVRLTTQLRLKTLGIWHEILPSGRRSSFPHAHTHEEEFAYIIKGHPTAWLNGYTKQLKPGDAVVFIPNSCLSHCLINDTDEPVVYMSIGEATDFPDEKILYPLNPLRNKECARKNWYWENAPAISLGAHNGRPLMPFPEHLKLRPCSETDVDEVLKIFQTSPIYFEHVDGCLPTRKTALHAISNEPKKKNESYFKEFLIIEHKGESIGVVDLHGNHPEPGMTYLDLFLISKDLFSQGLERRCYELVEDYVKTALDSHLIRPGASDDNG